MLIHFFAVAPLHSTARWIVLHEKFRDLHMFSSCRASSRERLSLSFLGGLFLTQARDLCLKGILPLPRFSPEVWRQPFPTQTKSPSLHVNVKKKQCFLLYITLYESSTYHIVKRRVHNVMKWMDQRNRQFRRRHAEK